MPKSARLPVQVMTYTRLSATGATKRSDTGSTGSKSSAPSTPVTHQPAATHSPMSTEATT